MASKQSDDKGVYEAVPTGPGDSSKRAAQPAGDGATARSSKSVAVETTPAMLEWLQKEARLVDNIPAIASGMAKDYGVQEPDDLKHLGPKEIKVSLIWCLGRLMIERRYFFEAIMITYPPSVNVILANHQQK